MIKYLCIALNIAGLALVTGNVQAYINQIDPARDIITQNQLDELSDTAEIAETVWNKLTAEFVSLFETGEYAQAGATAQTAYNLAENAFGHDNVNTADSLLKLGIISDTLGNYEKAKEHLIGALAILEQRLGPRHEDVAVVLTNLANVYFEQDQPLQSEKHHIRALQIRLNALGEDHPSVAQSMYNLAVLYDDLEQYSKAQDLYEASIEIWNQTLGPVHPYIANALNNLANVHVVLDNNSIAIELHRHSLSLRRQLYGNQHAEVARSLINLGALYVKQSNYEQAKPLYIEAVSVAEGVFGTNHPQVAMLLYSLANIYHIQGRIKINEPQQIPIEAVALSIPPMPVIKTDAREELNVDAQDYFSQALPLYERALRILDTTLGTNHPAVSAMLNEMAMLYTSVGKTTKAEQMLARLGHIE